MARTYTVISADSHLDLSPDLWAHHIPSKYREHAPRVVHLPRGDGIQMGDNRPNVIGLTRSVNVPREELHLQIPRFETAGGTGPPQRRLQEQDQDAIDAEILFSRVGYLRQALDRETYLALNHAYNQYLAEEYRMADPTRLFPMGVIPTTGVDDGIAELEYCAEAGLKGGLLDKFPNGKGYPTPEDDRFWAAALDCGIAITHHTTGGTTRMTRANEPTFNYARLGDGEGDGEGGLGNDPMRHWLFRFCGDAACAPVQMALAAVWARFPDLQIYWAETMVGWLEYALWQIDDHYERYKYLATNVYGLEWLERMPSEYIQQHCYWGFLSDPIGVKRRHDSVGPERMMWGSDFAHAASSWPNSRKIIERDFADVPEDEKYLILAGNAIRFFHLDAE